MCCIQYYKGTILKAIHNKERMNIAGGRLYPILQRYNFESNSQHNFRLCNRLVCCIQYYKGTILKAIHNEDRSATDIKSVVSNITKVQF